MMRLSSHVPKRGGSKLGQVSAVVQSCLVIVDDYLSSSAKMGATVTWRTMDAEVAAGNASSASKSAATGSPSLVSSAKVRSLSPAFLGPSATAEQSEGATWQQRPERQQQHLAAVSGAGCCPLGSAGRAAPIAREREISRACHAGECSGRGAGQLFAADVYGDDDTRKVRGFFTLSPGQSGRSGRTAASARRFATWHSASTAKQSSDDVADCDPKSMAGLEEMTERTRVLAEGVLSGNHMHLNRAINLCESWSSDDRAQGTALLQYLMAKSEDVRNGKMFRIGLTGPPGSGKSSLIERFSMLMVETVGGGQSDTAVAELVDMLVLVLPPAGGDELQGLKKGIVEVADLLVVNKADGETAKAALATVREYKRALHFLRPSSDTWVPPVIAASTRTREGIEDLLKSALDFRAKMTASGELEGRQREQSNKLMWRNVRHMIAERGGAGQPWHSGDGGGGGDSPLPLPMYNIMWPARTSSWGAISRSGRFPTWRSAGDDVALMSWSVTHVATPEGLRDPSKLQVQNCRSGTGVTFFKGLAHALSFSRSFGSSSRTSEGTGGELPASGAVEGVHGRRPIVAVGISGGVDSSVAAWLLKQRGFEVVGLFMKNWDLADEKGGGLSCGIDKELEDAKRVCHCLNIPLHEVDCVQRYWVDVFESFVSECAAGLTPNPDLTCNRHIKFDALLERAFSLGADALATGHYARLRRREEDGKMELLRGLDDDKDQSYFLASVNQQAFQRVMFPVGGMRKAEVREVASVAGLPTADKKSSVGICFIGKRRFGEFISDYVELEPGPFVEVENGAVVGKHGGIACYTIGQRARIGGAADAWFVVGKDVPKNVVFVAMGKDNPALFCRAAALADPFWVSGEPPKELEEGVWNVGDGGGGVANRVLCSEYKARYRQPSAPCKVEMMGDPLRVATACSDLRITRSDTSRLPEPTAEDVLSPSAFWKPGVDHERLGPSGSDKGSHKNHSGFLKVQFETPARAITPRQALVLYQGDVCLGGGLILYPGQTLLEEQMGAHESDLPESHLSESTLMAGR
ncbi:hypothetical protein CBR_g19922 [Chara braunii]|uniref:tRNA-5-taurinomethyluridine 2-sulfurtransferase n=1 Tax=Chara braunii TaxID=69332 RepID=A0A388KZ11_CHABU|nr:hypothetical protein CBR_g19922 [Chara braunii]|eukprot:GBG75289.1 hypothetical protein CBR_g19922 [Chara braunii]